MKKTPELQQEIRAVLPAAPSASEPGAQTPTLGLGAVTASWKGTAVGHGNPDHVVAVREALRLGAEAERNLDWGQAIRHYRQALELNPAGELEAYFSHNNLGFSLIQLDRFGEARFHCVTAIGINDRRHNAHKNLGLALTGLGHIDSAAHCFIQATRLCPNDHRAMKHLEDLLAAKPQLLARSVSLRKSVEDVRLFLEQRRLKALH